MLIDIGTKIVTITVQNASKKGTDFSIISDTIIMLLIYVRIESFLDV